MERMGWGLVSAMQRKSVHKRDSERTEREKGRERAVELEKSERGRETERESKKKSDGTVAALHSFPLRSSQRAPSLSWLVRQSSSQHSGALEHNSPSLLDVPDVSWDGWTQSCALLQDRPSPSAESADRHAECVMSAAASLHTTAQDELTQFCRICANENKSVIHCTVLLLSDNLPLNGSPLSGTFRRADLYCGGGLVVVAGGVGGVWLGLQRGMPLLLTEMEARDGRQQHLRLLWTLRLRCLRRGGMTNDNVVSILANPPPPLIVYCSSPVVESGKPHRERKESSLNKIISLHSSLVEAEKHSPLPPSQTSPGLFIPCVFSYESCQRGNTVLFIIPPASAPTPAPVAPPVAPLLDQTKRASGASAAVAGAQACRTAKRLSSGREAENMWRLDLTWIQTAEGESQGRGQGGEWGITLSFTIDLHSAPPNATILHLFIYNSHSAPPHDPHPAPPDTCASFCTTFMSHFTKAGVLSVAISIPVIMHILPGLGEESTMSNVTVDEITESEASTAPYPISFRASVTSLLVLEIVLGLGSNLTVLVLYCMKSDLVNSVSNVVTVNLHVLDVAVCVCCIPLTATVVLLSLGDTDVDAPLICCFHEACVSFASVATAANVLAITLDRYDISVRPANRVLTMGRAAALLGVVGFFSQGRPDRNQTAPRLGWGDQYRTEPGLYYHLLAQIPIFCFTAVVMLVTYARILQALNIRIGTRFHAVQRKKKAAHRRKAASTATAQQEATETTQSSATAAGGAAAAPHGATRGRHTVMGMRASVSVIIALRRAVKRHRERRERQKRVFRMSLLIVSTFLLCWTPITALNAVILSAGPNDLTAKLRLGFLVMAYGTTIFHPLLYAFARQKFQKVLRSTMKKRVVSIVEADPLPNNSVIHNSWIDPKRNKSVTLEESELRRKCLSSEEVP
ncbi:hypothetical protein JZ751_016842 [Albula glossodonta]|uniref:G-protein coupled receptors family 1 profile domain-containing protein n=1 Tax=Albula glossodonta TaxID=121402 RepID=A0A8T2NT51_9TELE|nr:hypothetical protein JZ751_016842 [Albula glossodonta]